MTAYNPELEATILRRAISGEPQAAIAYGLLRVARALEVLCDSVDTPTRLERENPKPGHV